MRISTIRNVGGGAFMVPQVLRVGVMEGTVGSKSSRWQCRVSVAVVFSGLRLPTENVVVRSAPMAAVRGISTLR